MVDLGEEDLEKEEEDIMGVDLVQEEPFMWEELE